LADFFLVDTLSSAMIWKERRTEIHFLWVLCEPD